MKEIIFVSFEPGTRGHYIARVIATMPHVHWYSHLDNGIHPWNLASAKNSSIRQRHAFANHFDRLVDGGKLPPTHDYVENFFPDDEQYYTNIFMPRFEQLTQNIDKTLIYCTHSSPRQLLKFFNNCKILNVVESTTTVVNKYLNTTANFPGYIRAAEIVDENNDWLQVLNQLKNIKTDFTVADLWAWQKHKLLYVNSMQEEYATDLYLKFEPKINERNMYYDKTLPIRMHPDWDTVKKFLLK
jgi:hypothetical protein